ncbi:ATP-binding cassette domain-containing protein [Streptomyces sp. R302]|nr:ATP-binding cassette domain-containing protein [Streptomyces sp. R301]NML81386.1 ATP-binding cassette domain-containing protein [Streptomyces sp. R302]
MLAGPDLEARAGEPTVLLGPNGAGKSTLPRTLCGLLPPRDGRIRIGGSDLAQTSPTTLARRLAVVPTAPEAQPGSGGLRARRLCSVSACTGRTSRQPSTHEAPTDPPVHPLSRRCGTAPGRHRSHAPAGPSSHRGAARPSTTGQPRPGRSLLGRTQRVRLRSRRRERLDRPGGTVAHRAQLARRGHPARTGHGVPEFAQPHGPLDAGTPRLACRLPE